MKNINKIMSLLLTLSLLLGIPVSVHAEMDNRVRTRVEGVGLMEGYEDGSFGEDDELTRAQMCMIAARILQIDSVPFGISPFTDVAEDHWAKDVIATLSQLGIVNGMGDGIFLPDESVSYTEAAKILVSVLGYGSRAENAGGYPSGYMAQASRLGLLKRITPGDGPISRGDVAQMLYGALDTKPIGYNFMQNYPEAELTLYEILSDIKELVQIRGILTETDKSSLTAVEPSLKKGNVMIGGKKLLSDMAMEDFLGCELIAYAYLDESEDRYRIKSFNVTNNVEIYEADAENIEWDGSEVVLLDDEGEELEKLTLAADDTLVTMYNGRKADVATNARDISYGSCRFVDYDGNGEIDILFIDEAQSFIIDRVNVASSTVYFKDRAELNGRNAVVLDKEDNDKSISLTDIEGKECSVSDLEANTAITVFASKDLKFVKAIVSDKTVSGRVTEKNENSIRIDDTYYDLAKKPNGEMVYEPKINEEATYLLDCYGKLIGNIGSVKSSYTYAYIINAETGSGLDSSIFVQTITGQKPKKEVVVKQDDETISYYFQNNDIKVYECDKNCKYYFYQYDNEYDSYYRHTYVEPNRKTEASAVTPLMLKEKLAAFRLNAEGKIKELYMIPTDEIGTGYGFNADILSFGGENVINRGFATDEDTMFICVPETLNSDEDFYVQVKISDDAGEIKVHGGVFFPEVKYDNAIEEPVDILMIKTEMNSSVVKPVPIDGDVCMVGKVFSALDENDEQVYGMKLLDGKNETKVLIKVGSNAEETVKKLRKGDLIRYVKDGADMATNITKLVSVQGLENNYSNRIIVGSGVENAIYGMAYHSVFGVFDYMTNRVVDRLQLAYDTNGENLSNIYRLPHEDMPRIYKYDRRNGWVSPGSIDDVRSYDMVGSDADSILAILENNDIKALVLITDY